MIKHNHATKNIKPRGQCPACDLTYVNKPKVTKPDILSRSHENEKHKKQISKNQRNNRGGR